MSKSVDTRVVEMKFNNSQFEQGVKSSLSTLEKLKAALKSLTGSNKALDGIGKTSKASGIDAIAQSVANLEKRFSVLGIVGQRVIQNLTDSLMGTLGKGVNFVTDSIVSGGIKRATNLENAHFQLQALFGDEEKVQAVMKNANDAVNGTAYSFDVAAKAASMFAASGINAGEEMENALKGIVGTAAMTNADFERVSMIFTAVAGQGRIMGDQLLQLSSLGLNAPATIAKYFNEIDKDTTKASDSVKKAVHEITNGKEITESEIRELVSDGQISFKIFAEAMNNAFGESAERANETFSGAMSNIKSALARIGAGFVSPLIEQNSAVIGLINRVREKINEVKSALVFDEEIGNVGAYSKRFTDALLKMADGAAKFVSNLDIESGMKVFYNVVDSVINVVKALGSVLAPVGKAFADVFLSFKVGDVINVTEAIKNFTEGLILSERQSKNLHDAFEGVFSVIKLLVDGFFALLRAILPISAPVSAANGGFLELIGTLGRGLKSFVDWIRQSTLVSKSLSGLKAVVSIAGNVLKSFVGAIGDVIKRVAELGLVEKAFNKIAEVFSKLATIVAPVISEIVDGAKQIGSALAVLIPAAIFVVGEKFISLLLKIVDAVHNFKIEDFSSMFEKLKTAIKSFIDTAGEPFSKVIDSIKGFGESIKDALNFDKAQENLSKFQSFLQGFADFMTKIWNGIFGESVFGGVAAAAGSTGMLYGIIKIAQALEKIGKSANTVPKLLGKVGKAVEGWGAQMKASAIKESAEAILILAGALVVLSFTDTDKALQAATALSEISAVLLGGTSLLAAAVGKGFAFINPLNTFAKQAGKALNNLAKAVKWKAIGSAFKDIAATITIIAVEIVALGYLYQKNASMIEKGGAIVGIIAGALFAMMAGMNIINKVLDVDAGDTLKSAGSVVAIAAAIGLIVGALNKIFKIEIPQDWVPKVAILVGILIGTETIMLAVAGAAKLAGGNTIKATGTLLASVVVINSLISALNKIFKMELPSDMPQKILIFAGVIAAFTQVLMVIANAARVAGGALKVAPALIAMALDIAVITGALMILSIIPTGGMLAGAIALSAVLGTLAAGLAAASKITNENAHKIIINMAISVGTIAASLAILALIPIEKLAVSALALGSMLLALAGDFLAVSKISNESVWKTVVSMVAVIATISISLVDLSQQPWDRMLAAGVAMGLALVAYAAAFAVLAKADQVSLKQVAAFLAVSLAFIPIGAALVALSGQPWQGMLAAAGSMALVLAGMTAAFAVISKSTVKAASVVGFVACAIALIPIAAALKMLSGQSWSALIPGATALVGVMTGIAAALKIVSGSGVNLTAVVGFVAAAVALIPIANVIQQLSGLSWEEIAKGLVALAGGLVVIGAAGYVGTAIAPGLLALSAALIAFAAAMAAVGLALPVFINGLTTAVNAVGQFASNLAAKIPEFIDIGKNMMLGLLQGIVGGISAVVEGVKSVATGVVDTVKGVLGIHSPSTVLEALGFNVDEGFINGILGGSGGITDALNSVFGSIQDQVDVDALYGKGEEATSMFGDGLMSGEGQVDAIMQQIADATGMDVSSFGLVGEEATGKLAAGMKKNEPSVAEQKANLVKTMGINLNPFDLLGQNATNEYNKGLKKGEGTTKNTLKQITDASKIDVSSYTNLGKKAADSFSKGVTTGAKNSANEAAANVAKTLKTAIDSSVKGVDWTVFGRTVVENISKGITAAKDKADSAVKAITKSMTSAIKSADNTFKSDGTKSMSFYISGVKSKSNEASNAVKDVIKKITNAFKSSNKDMKSKGEEATANYAKGISAKEKEAVKAVTDICSSLVKTLKGKASSFAAPGTESAKKYTSALKTAMNSNIKAVVNNMQTYGKQFVNGIVKGINANMGLARDAASKLAKAIDQQVKKDLEIHSPSKKAEESGKNFDLGFMEGILANIPHVTSAVSTLAAAANDVLIEEAKKTGELDLEWGNVMYAAATVATGKNWEKTIRTEAEYWRQLLNVKQQGAEKEKYIDMDLNEFRKQTMEEYKSIMKEYNDAMDQEKKSVFDQIGVFEEIDKSLFRTREEQAEVEYQAAKKEQAAAEAKKKASKTSKETTQVKKEEVKSLLEIAEEQEKLSDKYTKAMRKLKKKIGDENVWEYIKTLTEKDYPYIKELVNMTDDDLARYCEVIDNRLENAFEVARVRGDDVTKTMKDAVKDLFDFNEKAIDDTEVQYNKRLTVEEEYWTKLMELKNAEAEKEKEEETELAQFRKGVLDETNNIIKEYRDQMDSITESVLSQTSLFDKVGWNVTKTSEELQQALESQVKAYQRYQEIMAQLTEKLSGKELLEYLKTLGTSSLSELNAINNMTEEELALYSDTYDKKLEEAGKIASTKMEDITADTKEKLEDLFGGMTEINIDEFLKNFDGSIESLEKFLMGMCDTLNETQDDLVQSTEEMTTALNESLYDGLQLMAETAEETTVDLGEALANGLTESEAMAVDAAGQVAEGAIQAIADQNGNFQNAGRESGDNYTKGVDSKKSESKQTGTTLAINAIAGIDSKANNFTTEGKKEGTNYVNGLKSQIGASKSAGVALAEAALQGIRSKFDEFYNVGREIVTKMIEGLQSTTTYLEEVIKTFIEQSMLKPFGQIYSKFYNIGRNAGEGLIAGLESMISDVERAASALAAASTVTIQSDLEIASPSKVMKRLGGFAGEGFVNGLAMYVAKVATTSKELGDATTEGLTNHLGGLSDIFEDLSDQPTIKPEVDLSDVQMSVKEIQAMFNAAIQTINGNAVTLNGEITRAQNKKQTDQMPLQQQAITGGETKYEFVQNNYSPQALSRVDIYRQTRNQFELFRTATAVRV